MYKYSQQELTMINERKLQEIQNVKNALDELNAAIESEEYANDFHFKKPANAEGDLKIPRIRSLASKLNSMNIGFNPSLIIQHIEKEVLRQFNETVETYIRGVNAEELMKLKHELEKFDMKDRIEYFSDKLVKLEKELAESHGVEEEKASKKANNKKTNKKG